MNEKERLFNKIVKSPGKRSMSVDSSVPMKQADKLNSTNLDFYDLRDTINKSLLNSRKMMSMKDNTIIKKKKNANVSVMDVRVNKNLS